MFGGGLGFGVAAGDAVDFAGDVGGVVGGEEDVGGGEFGGLAGACERCIAAEGFEFFGGLAAAGLEWGPDGARGDAVDADATGDELF